MTPQKFIAAALDLSIILRAQGIDADPWQRDILFCTDRQILMNCCRQSDKSTVIAKALNTAFNAPRSLTLILSPGQRQSAEVFHKIVQAYNTMNRPVRAEYETQLKIELANGSRVICLPDVSERLRISQGFGDFFSAAGWLIPFLSRWREACGPHRGSLLRSVGASSSR